MSYPASPIVQEHRDHAEPSKRGAPFPWAILLGGALVVVGLGFVVFAVSMRDDSPFFMLGGIAVGAGVLRLTTALSRDARRRRELADPDDPRWHGGSGIVQLAGRTCIECTRKIVIGADALSCKDCGSPAHIDCAAQHRERAHSRLHDGTAALR
jgi:hypothetical protein